MLNKIIKKIPKDFSIVFLFDIVSKLLMGIVSIFIIRILTKTEYAMYVKFNTISNLLLSIVGTGVATAFVRCATEHISRGNRFIYNLYKRTLILIMTIPVVVVVLLIPAIKEIYNVDAIIIVFALIYGVFLAINRINQSYFQAKEKYTKSGLIDNIKNIIIVFVIVILYFVSRTNRLNSVIVSYVVCTGIAFIIGLIIIKKEKKKEAEASLLDSSQTTFSTIFKDGFWLIIYFILLNLIDQTDIIMLTKYVGSEGVASYGVALKYYSLLLSLQGTLTTVLRVRTSKKEMVDNASDRKQFSRNWIKNTWKIITLGCIIIIVFATPMMKILNGNTYNDAILAFKVFVVGVGISYIFSPNVAVMMAAQKHKQLCLLAFVGLIINATINWFFLGTYGVVVAAVATVVANAVINIISFVLIEKDR